MKYFIGLVVLLIGCHSRPLSEIEKLPPITQSGNNTFGCLINNKAYIWDEIILTSGGGDVIINADNFKSEYIGIALSGRKSYRVSPFPITYQLDDSISVSVIHQLCSYSSDFIPHGYGSITITSFKPPSFSGTFNFTIPPQEKGCDSLKVTNGRFDIKLN